MAAPIVVFAHLRWDFVYQRPQQVLSRIARHRRILFIEEPIRGGRGEDGMHIRQGERGRNIQVFTPVTPLDEHGFTDAQIRAIAPLVRDLVRHQVRGDYALWFYTPMALPLAEQLQPIATVYDCMDELSAFKNAPAALLERERILLERADVVFTGGPSLYEAKRDRHHNVHCFPSSVDGAHFGQARQPIEPDPHGAIPRPRLGFYGVVDERFDVPLLDAIAQAHPEWQLVIVGPVVKIDAGLLPRRPNIHYFGQRSYEELPRFLAGWDVAMLPFARNRSTQFISPTKTLEYMAAHKPIVSTPITDVARPYGQIVYLGSTPAQFIAACEAALSANGQERRRRETLMDQVLARTSWDATARSMNEQIELAIRRTVRASARSATRSVTDSVASAAQRTPPVLVAGAGPTGLSAAYHLGEDALLFEKADSIGGWCRSIQVEGFTFDYAGHIMFSKDPYVHEMYAKLLGDNVHWQDREAWVYSKNVYTRYPFQGCLYGLPADVIAECIVGAIEARFGPLSQDRAMRDAVADAAARSRPVSPDGEGEAKVTDCCADGVMEAEVELAAGRACAAGGPDAEPANFEEFIYKVWGRGIARHFAIPYNRKLWAVDLKEMETSWLGGRVPMPDVEEMIRYALTPAAKPMGPNARFGYPLHGGFQSLMNGFLPYVKDRLRLNAAVAAVSPARRTVMLGDGTELPYQVLISTMPLPMLIRSMGHEAPPEVRKAAAALRSVSVRCVHLGIGRENITDKHWVYYPEDTVFHRIFVQGNASPHCNPPGGFGLTCEITYSPSKPLPCEGDALTQRCIDDCRRVGIIRADDPVWAAAQCDMPYAYVVYDHARPRHVALIRDWLSEQDIVLAGRYSEWEYYNSDHAFIAGKHAAEQARQVLRGRATTRSGAAASSRVRSY